LQKISVSVPPQQEARQHPAFGRAQAVVLRAVGGQPDVVGGLALQKSLAVLAIDADHAAVGEVGEDGAGLSGPQFLFRIAEMNGMIVCQGGARFDEMVFPGGIHILTESEGDVG